MKLQQTGRYVTTTVAGESVDAFVPVVDLKEVSRWLPAWGVGQVLVDSQYCRFTTGGLVRIYLCLHIAAGWVITSLLIMGLSGLVRR